MRDMEFLKDLWGFLRVRKKYWMLPLILILLLFGVLIVLTTRHGHCAVHLHPVLERVGMPTAILGISAYYHDSAAALLVDGEIVAAAHEERFTRKKHDPSFPINACDTCCEEAGLELRGPRRGRRSTTSHISSSNGCSKPTTPSPRRGLTQLSLRHSRLDQGEALHEDSCSPRSSRKLGDGRSRSIFPEHHLSHAASAFYPSPFDEAAILTIDGVGEWATTTIGHGEGSEIEILQELQFPHSVGLLYSAFTYYTGFKVNSGEYKLMGLAPYGNPDVAADAAIQGHDPTSWSTSAKTARFLLNMDYFNYATGLTMCERGEMGAALRRPAGGSRRREISQEYMDMALAIQQVTEEIVLRLARTAKELTEARYLVLAGGVALNCVANGKLLKAGMFDDIWIQPAAGDAGGALGAAYAVWHIYREGNERHGRTASRTAMKGAYLGPEFCAKDDPQVASASIGASAATTRISRSWPRMSPPDSWPKGTSSGGFRAGWNSVRGPWATGASSAMPRNPEMQKKMNLKIKYREGFRPFAPSVLEEDIGEYFDLDRPSPYMLLVAPVTDERRKPLPDGYHDLPLYDRLYYLRSDLPAITHIDYSARIQSVNKKTNPRYWQSDQRLQEADRLRGDREHELQRPGRADRLHAGRCLPLLHAHGDGLPGDGRLSLRKEGTAEVPGRERLEEGIQARLAGPPVCWRVFSSPLQRGSDPRRSPRRRREAEGSGATGLEKRS